MSGHSKWHSIKHKKAAVDAKRGALFSRLIRELTVAARDGGGDPNFNPRLRTAVAACKAANMPAKNIDNAIKKGTGEIEGANYEEITYEGYGPGGVAVLVMTLTDNRNRTSSEVRHAFSKNNGNLGEPGSVMWMFDKRGRILLSDEGKDEDEFMMEALEAGAEDVVHEEGEFAVYTDYTKVHEVREALEAAGCDIESAEAAMIPKNTVKVTEEKDAKSLLKMLSMLEELDDAQSVAANFEMDDELMEMYGGE
ncbi:YebC/PmpR family DNA-binding transcriptional regulator [Candidatus Sumerlaeota bacterium]|nr:YebC/PmpR family DNA-binding transcriptional regulator [Candidatus Sumerlaeota bacterium]